MRKNEITVGEDYGYKAYSDNDIARRVKVLAVGVERTIYTGSYSQYRKNVKDGILIQFYDYENEELSSKSVRTTEQVEVSPEVYVEEFGYTIPARYEERETVTVVPNTDVVITRKLTQAWQDESAAQLAARNYKENKAKAEKTYESNAEAAAALSVRLLGKESSIRVKKDYDRGTGRVTTAGILISLEELKALVALADEAITNRNVEEARG